MARSSEWGKKGKKEKRAEGEKGAQKGRERVGGCGWGEGKKKWGGGLGCCRWVKRVGRARGRGWCGLGAKEKRRRVKGKRLCDEARVGIGGWRRGERRLVGGSLEKKRK
ncbi:hypothetical protein GOBAR_AA25018 [Gossypium barbadense]|uniref:Uncharacterized protein n=1 Tax=Gossypium barbadense TaxID=3634 RepID=A0A2P5WX47_GOSBA|nr:hypothetical protein GOBAR_AA25018 [Gossypium barbadense]